VIGAAVADTRGTRVDRQSSSHILTCARSVWNLVDYQIDSMLSDIVKRLTAADPAERVHGASWLATSLLAQLHTMHVFYQPQFTQVLSKATVQPACSLPWEAVPWRQIPGSGQRRLIAWSVTCVLQIVHSRVPHALLYLPW
jgi:hypothetical protein